MRDLRRPQAPLALRRAAGRARRPRALRGRWGGREPARRGPPAFHGARAGDAHRRAALPVPRGFRAHDPLREGARRAGAGGPERQQVLQAREGRLAGPQVRSRARVRQPPGCADRGRRRSSGGRGRHRHAGRPRAHGAQGEGARVAGRLPGQLRPEPVPLHAALGAHRDAGRAHQGHAPRGRLPSPGRAPSLLRGDDAGQGGALSHERRGHGRAGAVEGEPVRAGGSRPAARRRAALQGPATRRRPRPKRWASAHWPRTSRSR